MGTGMRAMTDDQLKPAARAAYDASCAIHGREKSDRDFRVQMVEWLAVARAAIASAPDDPEWPLRARVYTRTSTEPHEKILEIEGVVDDTYMTCRHVQTLAVADADVPGLPELYGSDELPATVSKYARGIAELHGLPGLEREARRLVHKIKTAASLYRDGAVKRELAVDAAVEKRIDHAVATESVGWLASELDSLQARIVSAQRIADPHGLASLVLHTDEQNWTRYASYAAYLESYGIMDR